MAAEALDEEKAVVILTNLTGQRQGRKSRTLFKLAKSSAIIAKFHVLVTLRLWRRPTVELVPVGLRRGLAGGLGNKPILFAKCFARLN